MPGIFVSGLFLLLVQLNIFTRIEHFTNHFDVEKYLESHLEQILAKSVDTNKLKMIQDSINGEKRGTETENCNQEPTAGPETDLNSGSNPGFKYQNRIRNITPDYQSIVGNPLVQNENFNVETIDGGEETKVSQNQQEHPVRIKIYNLVSGIIFFTLTHYCCVNF